MHKIVLHRAHTPPFKNAGSSGFGVTERTVIESVVAALKSKLLEVGCNVIVRDGINLVREEADLFLAVHCDGNKSPAPRGFGVYRPKLQTGANEIKSMEFESLLEKIYAIDTGLPHKDRDTKNTDFYYGFDFFPKAPACLIEMGFITNENDHEVLVLKQDLIVGALYRTIAQFLKLETTQPDPAFADAWKWAKENGIMTAASNPDGVVTDARLAVFLKRYHDKFNK